MVLYGVFGLMCAAQQWLLTISFCYAEASLLAPLEYLAMVFAAIVGYVFLGGSAGVDDLDWCVRDCS